MQECSPVRYCIDSEDRLVAVNAAWQEFALANDGQVAGRERVLGRPLWDFIGDLTTRQLYRDLAARVRAGRPVAFPIRCDSPTERRLLNISMAPAPAGGVCFEAALLRSETRPAVHLLDGPQPRSHEILKSCGWCRRVEAAGQWAEVEEAVVRLRLFETSDLPLLSHGICPPCLDSMRAVVEMP